MHILEGREVVRSFGKLLELGRIGEELKRLTQATDSIENERISTRK